MKARESKIPAQGKPRLGEASERIIHLYESWGKPDKAAEWKQKLESGGRPLRQEP